MRHTNEVEKEMEKEMSAGTQYWDCFKGVNRRRTEIVMIGWLVQCMFLYLPLALLETDTLKRRVVRP